ncbi:MAG: PQQ-binding-like beta-propeller repeat protein, partial [Planctomycetota bacterium]
MFQLAQKRFRIWVWGVLALGLATPMDAQEWPWRGPQGNGHAATTQTIPTQWSEDEQVLWSTPVPGRGHSSPIVSQGKIFLTTADEDAQTQSVCCFDLASGKQLWCTQCHAAESLPRIHPKNTHASPSIAIGDDRAFA